ncbi:MAG: sugar nucleotide-binding protein, partial [Deinococcales bacterium]|nr:sugar nucleotide-binding protein [Chitinophagaceae bacterium]
MTILITGANGFLGQYLCTSLANKGFKVIATSRGICKIFNVKGIKYQSVDVTKKEDVVAILAIEKPDIVIHNAAMSKPDICNTNQAECILQNVTATSYILDGCKLINPYFIYISTDFVFGEGGPYDETVTPAPLNFYGQSKLIAEQLVLASNLQVAIVRP